MADGEGVGDTVRKHLIDRPANKCEREGKTAGKLVFIEALWLLLDSATKICVLCLSGHKTATANDNNWPMMHMGKGQNHVGLAS